MSVKASISLTESQEAFARDMVAQGRFSSLSAVVQQGLDLLRERTEAEATEVEALRVLLEERRAGSSVGMHESRARTRALLSRKRAAFGLQG